MKKICSILLFLLIGFNSWSQQQGNIWYFGNHAGLDFSTGSPVVLTDGQTEYVNCPGCHAEGTAGICDNTGSLLFYTDGLNVWNNSHSVMPNGDSLYSNISATQGALILPLPANDRYYYIFTVSDCTIDDLTYGFRYSVVDMCLDFGDGDVIDSQKNVFIQSDVSEKLTAVRHANGIDYWVIVHAYSSNAFYAYQFSPTGIGAPVISNVGTVHSFGVPSPCGGAIGQLKASPNGEKLVAVNVNSSSNFAEYFDFDANTGIVSNWVNIQWNPNYNFYGASFSPDNSKLYVSCTLNGNGIYQFDLTAGGGDSAAVVASKTLIADTYNYLGLQLANDGKIYVARSPFLDHTYLSVINEPNLIGNSCDYIDSAVNLLGNAASYGFPNFVDSYDYSNDGIDCEATVSEEWEELEIQCFPNPTSDGFNIKLNQKTDLIEIKIFNSLGELVSYKSDGECSEIFIETKTLSSGLYSYLVTIDKKIIAGKLVVEN